MATNSANGPVSVVNSSVNSVTGVITNNVLLTTRYPFHKLDSTLTQSFQIITVFFNTEPPDPTSPTTGNTTTSKTLVYKYAHGYTYLPSTWFLLSLDGFSTTIGAEGATILNNGALLSSAYFNVEVDTLNVYFYVTKSWPNPTGTVPAPPHIIGFAVSVRAYIFVEDLTGTSVPLNA